MRSVKHGGKKGMRYRYKSSAIKRQNNKQKKKLRKVAGCPVIDQAWDTKMTTRQDLAAMGLAYDPNEVIGKAGSPSDLMEVDEVDIGTAKSLGSLKQQKLARTMQQQQKAKKGTKEEKHKTGQVLKELEQIAIDEAREVAEQKKRKRQKTKLIQTDVDFCEKMVEKHGKDYEAMSRDSANLWQNTARQIERKIAIYRRSQGN